MHCLKSLLLAVLFAAPLAWAGEDFDVSIDNVTKRAVLKTQGNEYTALTSKGVFMIVIKNLAQPCQRGRGS